MTSKDRNSKVSEMGDLYRCIRQLKAELQGVDVEQIDEAIPMSFQEQRKLNQWLIGKGWCSPTTCPSCGVTTLRWNLIDSASSPVLPSGHGHSHPPSQLHAPPEAGICQEDAQPPDEG